MNRFAPTPEQKAILKAKGHRIRINARAGTGKTTSLKLLAQQYPDQRILYLVFNRKAREEAKNSFPKHVSPMTVHALAYRHEGYKWKATLGHFGPADMLAAFGRQEQALATLSHDFLVYFLNSPHPRLEDALQPFSRILPEGGQEIFQQAQYRIVKAARNIATEWNAGQQNCPHDFYLKLCHKSGDFQAALQRYDIILVDEAQDLSPIMLDALKSYPNRIFLVGDTHQQIYSFRYAIDAMRKLSCDEEYELSQSFRFGQPIADLVSVFIQESKQQHRFQIHGNPRQLSGVELYRQIGSPSGSEPTAILSRSNVALFENAMQLRAHNHSFVFERDLYPLLMKTLDVYWLAEKRPESIRDSLIRSFHSTQDLEEFAKDTGNFQLQGMLEIVEKHADEFPGIVFELSERTRNQDEIEDKPDFVLSTIHSAKGQEYEQVYIDLDMAENLDTVFENDLQHDTDELNVAYVGFTRAIQKLYLPHEMQSLLGPRWGKLLRNCRKAAKSDRPTALHSGETLKTPDNNFPRQAYPKPKKRRKRAPRLGQRVRTSMGAGTILELSEEYCLVELDNYGTKLRERLSELL